MWRSCSGDGWSILNLNERNQVVVEGTVRGGSRGSDRLRDRCACRCGPAAHVAAFLRGHACGTCRRGAVAAS